VSGAKSPDKAQEPPPQRRPLNQVFYEWWRRLQNPSVARAEFHRALREGELVASLYQEGKELRALGRSYWQRARLEFDREEPLVVVVMLGDVPQPGSFYVSPAPRRPALDNGDRAAPASGHAAGQSAAKGVGASLAASAGLAAGLGSASAQAQRKHAGGRSPSFTSKQVRKLQKEQRHYKKDNPNALEKDVEQHLQDWAKDKLKVIASFRTIRDAIKNGKRKN
jgi:hypothetical protein